MKPVADAHGMLQVAISRAALEGSTGMTAIHIPLMDITDAEGPEFTEEAEDTMLKVTITTEWVDANDVDSIFESDYSKHNEDEL